MKKSIALVLGLLGMLMVADRASAQGVGIYVAPQINNPYYRPPVSPYLNLFRGGSSGGVNYYNLVRPQQRTFNELQRLQRDVTNLATPGLQGQAGTQLGGVGAGSGSGGHTWYQNHQGFFLNVRTGPVGGAGN